MSFILDRKGITPVYTVYCFTVLVLDTVLQYWSWSGTGSDPHVSKPTFRVEFENVCLRDLNRPSSQSNATFVSAQTKSGPKKADL
jgi:hypothetical protein